MVQLFERKRKDTVTQVKCIREKTVSTTHGQSFSEAPRPYSTNESTMKREAIICLRGTF